MSSSQRHDLQPAFLLHRKPFRDTSLLLELFSREAGRIGLVARGAQRPRSPLNGLLQPFRPLLVSWGGRGDLGTLYSAESDGTCSMLQGERLYAGFYLNELLMRLTQRHLPTQDLYERYSQTVKRLATNRDDYSWSLRLFERDLLMELGYGLQLDHDVLSDVEIVPDHLYSYVLERGPVPATQAGGQGIAISGRALLALKSDDAPETALGDECKRLMRAALALYLGERPLASREMFRRQKITRPDGRTTD